MDITGELVLGNYFIQFILLIVLIGLLSLVLVTGNGRKNGVSAFLAFVITTALIETLDTVSSYIGIDTGLFRTILIFIGGLQAAFLVLAVSMSWRHLNKPLFLAGAGLFCIIFSAFFLKSVIARLEIPFTLCAFAFGLIYYFLIIDFIIKLKRDKHSDSLSHFSN